MVWAQTLVDDALLQTVGWATQVAQKLPKAMNDLISELESKGLVISWKKTGYMANTTALALNPFVRQAGAASAMLGTIQLGAGAVSGLIVGVSYNGSALPLGLVVAGCGVLAGVTLRTAPAQT